MDTIAIYYTPLSSTKVAEVVGLGEAYHMALVYTDGRSRSYGASSGPSNHMTAQTPSLAVAAAFASTMGVPSAFGTLLSDPVNNHPFTKGRPEDYYTQDDEGDPYPFTVVMRGENLSAQWQTILRTYVAVGRLGLTYSPISQNSNSMAGAALRAAGIAIPFSSQTWFVPAVFTRLPLTPEEVGTMARGAMDSNFRSASPPQPGRAPAASRAP